MTTLKPLNIALDALIEAYPDIVSIEDSNIGDIVEVKYPSGMAFFMLLETVSIDKIIACIDSVLESIEEENEL